MKQMAQTASRSPTPPLSPSNEVEKDEFLDEISVRERLQRAQELKSEGNDNFRAKLWSEALVSYRTGLAQLPARKEQLKGKGKEKIHEESDMSSAGENADTNAQGKNIAETEDVSGAEAVNPIEAECATARAVIQANIGACHVKLGEHQEAVKACTQALLDDPNYVKALQRRAASNERINTWTSLASAQQDYTSILDLLPPSSPQLVEVRQSLQAIKPRVEHAQKQETGEMVEKLKGLGNSVLGNFGLSTDNFKFEPNGQGGYSMNFVR